jgi:hypothetical protein
MEEEGAWVAAALAVLCRLEAAAVWHDGRVQTLCNKAFGTLASCHTAIFLGPLPRQPRSPAVGTRSYHRRPHNV